MRELLKVVIVGERYAHMGLGEISGQILDAPHRLVNLHTLTAHALLASRSHCLILKFLSIRISSRMPFGEIVCGSPGSGKSTYCYGKHQLFTALNRPISIVNLDPANDNIPYPCAIDISTLITLKDVMQEHGLGPNGGMLYCMEYLEANYDWLEERLRELGEDSYILFDLPGQVELSTNHSSVKNVVDKLTKSGFRVCMNPLSMGASADDAVSWQQSISAMLTT